MNNKHSIPIILNRFMVFCLFLTQLSCGLPQNSNKYNITELGSTAQKTPEAILKPVTADVEYLNNQQLFLKKKPKAYNVVMRFFSSGYSPDAKPVRMRVRNGECQSIEPIVKNDQRGTAVYRQYCPVDKLFSLILTERAAGTVVSVEYDREFGFPRKIYLDYSRHGTMAYNKISIEKFELVNE